MCATQPTATSRWASLTWALQILAGGGCAVGALAVMTRIGGLSPILLAGAATAGAAAPVIWVGWWIGRPARRVAVRPPAPLGVHVVVEPSAVIIPGPVTELQPSPRALPAPVPAARHAARREAIR
jgi:hypothetical protein